jgi:isopentenyl-diphosphate delta-isomerase
MKPETVVLVNEQDEVVGTQEKMEAHKKGLLHRAFSVFIFNNKGEMLLQQRALNKYHSSGLWTNSCCSHPKPGEDTAEAAARRLQEEMGFSTELEKIFDFVYRAEFDNGLIEYEFDHVFAGEYDGPIEFNKQEVMDYCYKNWDDVRESLKEHPAKFTQWFHLAFPRIEGWWKQRYTKMAEISSI